MAKISNLWRNLSNRLYFETFANSWTISFDSPELETRRNTFKMILFSLSKTSQLKNCNFTNIFYQKTLASFICFVVLTHVLLILFRLSDVSTPAPPPAKIVVNVVSKEIQLPISNAKLTAFAIPESPSNSKTPYNYEWKLITGPAKGNYEERGLDQFFGPRVL